jgi:hypothetical protein
LLYDAEAYIHASGANKRLVNLKSADALGMGELPQEQIKSFKLNVTCFDVDGAVK